jgi:hypothetical protein
VTERKTAGVKSGRKAKGASRRARQNGPTKADIESYLALVALRSKPRHVTRVLPGTKLRLRFSEDERRLILDDWTIAMGLTDKQTKALEKAKRPELSMTLADWEDFMGHVASASNHARDGSRLQRRADALSDRIQSLLDSHTEEWGRSQT